jgi:hypothetical protein
MRCQQQQQHSPSVCMRSWYDAECIVMRPASLPTTLPQL